MDIALAPDGPSTFVGDKGNRAARAAVSGAHPLEQSAYKIDLAQGLVRQALWHLRP